MVPTASGKPFLSWVGALPGHVYQVHLIHYYPNAIHTQVLTLSNWLTGKILDVGADWGTTDPRTNVFSADTRYNLQTNDGANIFIRTEGPKSPSGQLHLRLIFETGSEKYYWMNNIAGKYAFISGRLGAWFWWCSYWRLDECWENGEFVCVEDWCVECEFSLIIIRILHKLTIQFASDWNTTKFVNWPCRYIGRQKSNKQNSIRITSNPILN